MLPHLLSGSEEGFADLSFRITELARTPDGGLSVVAKALFDEEPVGLRIMLGANWKPATLGEGIPVYWGRVTYQTIGQESDRFVRAVAAAYGLTVRPGRMKNEVAFTAVALKGDPADCPPGAVRMKLFFESEVEQRYTEVYTNVDPSNRSLGIREKDPDYRAALLAAITADHA